MKREKQVANAIALVQARRKAVGLQVSSLPTKVTDTTLYLVHRADGNANIVELTNDDTKKKVGITNFDGNKLAKGRDAVIDSMKIRVAKGGLVLNNVNWEGDKIALTKELAGAELQLIQDNVTLLSIGLSDLSLSNDDDNYRDIASTPFLVSEKPIKWVLTYADGVAIPAELVNGIFIKIECRAIQAIQ